MILTQDRSLRNLAIRWILEFPIPFMLSFLGATKSPTKSASDRLLSPNVELGKAMDIHVGDALKDSFGTSIWRGQLWFHPTMSR